MEREKEKVKEKKKKRGGRERTNIGVLLCFILTLSLLMGSLFIKEAAELILVDTISLIT